MIYITCNRRAHSPYVPFQVTDLTQRPPRRIERGSHGLSARPRRDTLRHCLPGGGHCSVLGGLAGQPAPQVPCLLLLPCLSGEPVITSAGACLRELRSWHPRASLPAPRHFNSTQRHARTAAAWRLARRLWLPKAVAKTNIYRAEQKRRLVCKHARLNCRQLLKRSGAHIVGSTCAGRVQCAVQALHGLGALGRRE
eukprot:scaffold269489_cov24-Tisochrysis_lutea.AAC.1